MSAEPGLSRLGAARRCAGLAKRAFAAFVAGADEAELADVRALFAEWDSVFSRFRPDGELSRVNRTRDAGGRPASPGGSSPGRSGRGST